jgi:Zn-dependent peptidase ImmA (M78 family)
MEVNMESRTGYIREMARKLVKDSGQSFLPIDLQKICSFMGFQYVEVPNFPKGLMALLYENNGVKYAAVNKDDHIHRRRFSLAHEFGHWKLGHARGYTYSEVTIDNPPDPEAYKKNSRNEEMEANEFAGELLVPLAHLNREMKTVQDIGELSERFNVSKEVITIRMMSQKKL